MRPPLLPVLPYFYWTRTDSLPFPLSRPRPPSLSPTHPRSLSARPKHNAFPPTLLELPFPLPHALEANIYFLTVPRPPPLARHDAWDAERAAQSHEAPPMYDEELAFGETVLERGGDLDVAVALLEYERASHAQDVADVSSTRATN